jgi:biopolymer transport protein ExbD
VRRQGFDRLDVTPFIDVLLVLLILFMVAVPEPERRLESGRPAEGGVSGATTARIRLGAELIWLDGRPLRGLDELGAALRERLQRGAAGAVLIEAEDRIAYDRLVAVVDTAAGAGAASIGIVDSATPGGGNGPVSPP